LCSIIRQDRLIYIVYAEIFPLLKFSFFLK
jgi:hypothetical protein